MEITVTLPTGTHTMPRDKAEKMLEAARKQVTIHNDTIRACIATRSTEAEITKYRDHLSKYAAAVAAFEAALA